MRVCLLFIALFFGLATAALAVQNKKPIIQLPPKSCTWVQTGTVVPSGAYTRDNQDGTLWKCTNGSWSRASGGSKGGSKQK